MTKLGHNLKWTLGNSHRRALRDMFTIFGVSVLTPTENMDLFTLADKTNIGVFYVADEDALTAGQMGLGAWIELCVDDEDAVTAELAEHGLRPFDYNDKQHKYFRAPGGQVFRLAATG